MGMTRYTRHGRALYKTQRWKAVRLQAKRRDGWACVQCGAKGRLEVDHVRPIREAPELSYDLANLQTLCPACHTRKTRVECGHPPLDPKRQQWRDLLTETLPHA